MSRDGENEAGLGYMAAMTREEIIATLQAHAPELRAMGVEGIALFGSRARGDATPTSDIDLLVRIDSEHKKRFTLFDLAGLRLHLQDVLKSDVDVLTLPIRKQSLREEVEREAIHAF